MAPAPVAAAMAVSAGVLALAIAAILAATRRESEAGRALAAVLAAEGALHLGAGLPPVAAEAGLMPLAVTADRVFLAALVAVAATYLLLLRELPTPLADALRRPGRDRTLRLALGGSVASALALGILAPAAAFFAGALLVLGVTLFALLAAVDARRRTARGSAMRARASAFLAAFVVRDAAYVLAVVLGFLEPIPGAATLVAAAGTVVYVPLLAAGVARTDLFLLRPRARPPESELPARFADARPLGRGTSWLARDVPTGARVVVKEVASLDAPACDAGRLGRPGVPRLVAAVSEGGRVFAAFEHVEGRTLREAIAEGRLPAPEVAALADGLLAALETLHDAELVHADVKPSNVVLGRDGAATLIDLGSCRRAGDAGPDEGTPRYMAPERARGQPPNARADVYAAGLCVWEALEGSPYLGRGGDALDALMRAAYPGAYRAPRAAPPTLGSWLERALAESASDGFADARVARGALPQRS